MGTQLQSSGGGKRDRTADLLHAMQALSHLSYTPSSKRIDYNSQSAFSARRKSEKLKKHFAVMPYLHQPLPEKPCGYSSQQDLCVQQ